MLSFNIQIPASVVYFFHFEDFVVTSSVTDQKLEESEAIPNLIVDPNLLNTKLEHKLNDPNVYIRLESDPTEPLSDELFQYWVKRKQEGYVTAVKTDVMVVTEKNKKSTLSHLKHKTSYFYPML